jgi:hypothetical protein
MTKANDDIETPYSAVATPVDGRCVPSEYSLVMKEAQDVWWNDDFFDEEDGVIAVFDFDYDQMTVFQTQTKAAGQFLSVTVATAYVAFVLGTIAPILAPIIVVGLYLLTLAPCFLRLQVQWEVESNHLAITRDGIRYVQDKRKGCWGFSMCDKGKSSKTVPFDKITDCDIIEPAGNQYLFFPRILYTVNVDTASSGGEGHRHELRISGLQQPHKFKALVWAMKRNPNVVGGIGIGGGYQAPVAQPRAQLEMINRNNNNPLLTKSPSTSSNSSGGVTGLLRDIRDELRQNNGLLKKMQNEAKNNKEEGHSNPSTEGTLL